MRGIVVTALMAAVLHAGGAAAESSTIEKDIDDCSKISRLPPAQAIAACTRLLAEPEVQYGWKKSSIAGIHSDRGYLHHKLKNYQQALADFSIAIRLEPSDSDNYLFRGRTHADLGEQQSAIRDYTHCIRLKPADSICHNNRGASYVRLRNYARAISSFSAAIRFDPKYASAYGSRGFAHEMSGHRQAAIRDYRKALQLGASHAEIRKRLAALEAGAAPSADPAPPARVQPPPGTPVDFTFRFRNNAGGIVRVKMYARGRNIWWPGARTNWRMDSVGPYSFTISCRQGEKVCYGAWRDEDTEKYWGTGFQDRYGCGGCCYTCVNGRSRIHNLNP